MAPFDEQTKFEAWIFIAKGIHKNAIYINFCQPPKHLRYDVFGSLMDWSHHLIRHCR